MKRSNFLKLNWRDLLKSLLLAVIAAVVTFVYSSIQSGVALDAEFLKKAGMVALATVLSYLLKNLFENNEGDLAKTDE
jgi:VIT1/CCC1 family predicted Fe2+/Mn2+ transporter